MFPKSIYLLEKNRKEMYNDVMKYVIIILSELLEQDKEPTTRGDMKASFKEREQKKAPPKPPRRSCGESTSVSPSSSNSSCSRANQTRYYHHYYHQDDEGYNGDCSAIINE